MCVLITSATATNKMIPREINGSAQCNFIFLKVFYNIPHFISLFLFIPCLETYSFDTIQTVHNSYAEGAERMKALRSLFKSNASRGHEGFSEEQLSKKADQATKNAGLARSALQKFSYALCNETTVTPEDSVIMGQTKSPARIIEKAVARYNGDVSKVPDVARDMILVDSMDQVHALLNTINRNYFRSTWGDKGVGITSIEDKFAKPHPVTGWRGLVVQLEIDLGKGRTQTAELQVIPRGMHDIYQRTHVYLEQIRELKDNAKALHINLSDHEKNVVSTHQTEARRMHFEGARDTGFLSHDEMRQGQDIHKFMLAIA